jgi:hypothetical protein
VVAVEESTQITLSAEVLAVLILLAMAVMAEHLEEALTAQLGPTELATGLVAVAVAVALFKAQTQLVELAETVPQA